MALNAKFPEHIHLHNLDHIPNYEIIVMHPKIIYVNINDYFIPPESFICHMTDAMNKFLE